MLDSATIQQAKYGTSRLLVSVRDAQEAAIAVRADVDLIDIKEPNRGSLGAAAPAVIEAILAEVAGRKPLSVALGELSDQTDHLAQIPLHGIRFAKVGLAGCARMADWQARWRDLLLRMPAAVQGVAVVYADWQSAFSPSPEEVIRHAGPFGCGAVLVDTYDKSSGDLLAHWTLAAIDAFVGCIKDQGMLAVVAGSLGGKRIDDVVEMGADYIAVRGAVCNEGRTGRIDARKLDGFVRQVRAAQDRLTQSRRRRL